MIQVGGWFFWSGLVWVTLAGAGLDCLLNGFWSMFNVIVAGTIAALLAHRIPNSNKRATVSKLFLLPHSLISHWSKQVM